MPIGHSMHMLPSDGLNSPVEHDWRGLRTVRGNKASAWEEDFPLHIRCEACTNSPTNKKAFLTRKRTSLSMSSLALHQTKGIQTSKQTHRIQHLVHKEYILWTGTRAWTASPHCHTIIIIITHATSVPDKGPPMTDANRGS